MLEYFTYKKIKKHQAQKEVRQEARRQADDTPQPSEVLDERDDIPPGATHNPAPPTPAVLRPEDESFLEELLGDDDEPAPPLPPQSYADYSEWPSDSDMASPGEPQKHDAEGLGKDLASKSADKKTGRLAMLLTRARKNEKGLKPHSDVPQAEGERETKDLNRVLDRLNLSARNKVVSTDSSQLLQRFTQVFKDLVNGVPTAYDDLTRLIEDRDGTLARGFDKLQSSLKKLVMQLPKKITGNLGPELLAAAAGSQCIKTEAQGGIKGVAKNILMPHNLAELVTKPGAIVGMLRAIVEVLKTRWPAFIGMNVIWSVALSLLLFVLWYCYKRGREERLLREKPASAIDGGQRIEELPDDPALPAPETRSVNASLPMAPSPLPADPSANGGRETPEPRRS